MRRPRPARAGSGGARPAAAGRLPVVADPDPGPRSGRHHCRPGARDPQRPGRRSGQRGAAPGVECGLGLVDGPPRLRGFATAAARAAHVAPGLDRRGLRRRARRRPRRDRGGAAGRRPAPGHPSGRVAGPARPRRPGRRYRRRTRPVLAVRGADVGRRPGRHRRRPRAPGRGAGRGQPTLRDRPRPRTADRAGRALARPVCRAGRQDGTAGRPGGRAGRTGDRERGAPAPGRARAARGRGVAGRGPGRATPGRSRAAATTGSCSTPRAPGWAHCAGDRRPAGAANRPTCSTSRRCRPSCSTRRCGWSAPVVSWGT